MFKMFKMDSVDIIDGFKADDELHPIQSHKVRATKKKTTKAKRKNKRKWQRKARSAA